MFVCDVPGCNNRYTRSDSLGHHKLMAHGLRDIGGPGRPVATHNATFGASQFVPDDGQFAYDNAASGNFFVPSSSSMPKMTFMGERQGHIQDNQDDEIDLKSKF